jgi:hypothetical protein
VEITEDRRFFEKFELMLRMAELAFESDSTRIVTLMLDAFRTPVFEVADQQKAPIPSTALAITVTTRPRLPNSKPLIAAT